MVGGIKVGDRISVYNTLNNGGYTQDIGKKTAICKGESSHLAHLMFLSWYSDLLPFYHTACGSSNIECVRVGTLVIKSLKNG